LGCDVFSCRFIDRSKLSLGLLALALPFTALVTSWHRSIQTTTQLEESQIKNQPARYMAHRKFFLDAIGKTNEIDNPIGLYHATFPNTRDLIGNAPHLERGNYLSGSIKTTPSNSNTAISSSLRGNGEPYARTAASISSGPNAIGTLPIPFDT